MPLGAPNSAKRRQIAQRDILHKRDIPAAVTLTSVGYNIVRSGGPAFGGVILAFFGPLTAFASAAPTPKGSVLQTSPIGG
ncbi:MFS transporter [Sinorhizobium meliloti]|uniref:MFS transporter n=1 Tax=Rhizobium meliloti TaxID=382 RepID=UPI003989A2AF